MWNSEPKTWFNFLLVFCCHKIFLFYSKINKFITTAITFAHLTLASGSEFQRFSEACEILNLKHGSISWLVFCCNEICFLDYTKRNKFITTAITIAHLTLASIWKKISEACEILNLETWFHFAVGILLSWNLFLYYSKRNKFITTAITIAHLTLASELKNDFRILLNSEPQIWFHILLVFCCNSFFFSIIPRSTNLLQRQ